MLRAYGKADEKKLARSTPALQRLAMTYLLKQAASSRSAVETTAGELVVFASGLAIAQQRALACHVGAANESRRGTTIAFSKLFRVIAVKSDVNASRRTSRRMLFRHSCHGS